jgi:hypothetical protein
VHALLSLQVEGQTQVPAQEQKPWQAAPQGVPGILMQVEITRLERIWVKEEKLGTAGKEVTTPVIGEAMLLIWFWST